MKKLIPLILVLTLLLSGCNLLTNQQPNQPLSDAEMATRVAELLATMTTPTTQLEFPTSAPQTLPTLASTPTEAALPTMTPVVVIATLAPTPMPPTAVPPTAAPSETAVVAANTPTPTATAPAGDPAGRLGTPSSVDEMNNADHWGWPTGADQYLSIEFANGFMKMTGLTSLAGWRLPLVVQQINTYIEMTANSGTCSDKDSYGIIFRVPVFKEPTQGYLYEVTCDGYYRLWKWDGNVKPNGLATSLITWKQSAELHQGQNQVNRLGVMSVDDRLILYANGVKLGEVKDASYPAGFFGTFVRSGTAKSYTVSIDQMRFWENPTP
ncbi:MAG: hypothetical protein ABFD24_02400 [Anaerolineaceae bacterium]|jgi:hypothetical protein